MAGNTKRFGVLTADGGYPASATVDGTETTSWVQGGVTVTGTLQDIADLGGGGLSDGDKGDITVSASGATWTVDNDAITYAKLQNVSVTQRVLGRNTAGAGDVEEVTLSQLLDWVGSPANGDLLYRSGGAWTRLAVGTNGHVLTLAAGLPTWAAAGGGGLTNWTDAVSTAAPNATVNVASLTVNVASPSGDAVVAPKGTGGGLAAAVANNLASGGNKRGSNAVDWQTNRSNNTEVASGASSVIPGGQNNTASGTHTFSSGQMSTVSGNHGFAHGQNNNATASQAIAMGGSCTASAANAVAIGASCTADGINSYATGSQASTRALFGACSHAVGTGKQRFELLLQRATTDATPTALTTTGTAATAANQFIVPGNRACNVEGRVTARNTTTGDSKSWRFDALVKNIANVTTLVGAVTPTVLYADAGAAAWTIAVTADDANDVMPVTATGAAATNIAWTCDLHSVET